MCGQLRELPPHCVILGVESAGCSPAASVVVVEITVRPVRWRHVGSGCGNMRNDIVAAGNC